MNIKFSNLKSPYVGPKFENKEIENEIKKITNLNNSILIILKIKINFMMKLLN